MPKKFMAHKLVVETAKALAHEMFTDVMRADNMLYASWKQQCAELTSAKAEELFVELMYPKLIESARATLARLLGDPTMQAVHETLYEALTKDYLFTHGRRAARHRELLEVAVDGSVSSKKSPLN